jgi:DNA-binding NtrC family response regulator
LGYHVLDASSGVEALKLWQDHADLIHLVLTDLVMPEGLGGWELVGRLRAEKPELKTIVMSGYRNKVPAAELQFKPAIEFLAKPFDMNTLACLVRNCLDEGRN